jgi:hypothetical protein
MQRPETREEMQWKTHLSLETPATGADLGGVFCDANTELSQVTVATRKYAS